jgi:hypothetical protein
MRQKMSLKSRKELARALKEAYRNAGGAEKKKLLDGFVEATGLHRKYAITLLKREEEEQPRTGHKRGITKYGNDVEQALLQVWKAAYFICSKRLAPFMAALVDSLERHGHLTISEQTKTKLLNLSPATIDRLLRPHRKEICKRTYYAKNPPSPLRSEIPIRTFADWEEKEAGYFEMDLVSHNGGDPHGPFCHTLVLTDVHTGFTDFTALTDKQDDSVIAGLEALFPKIPFAVKGLDIDNGSEFLNYKMEQFCGSRKINFTRGRAYRKNDQCYVEEKNGSIIRRHVGYRRLEGPAACQILLELYSSLRIFVNYFQPSAKLQSKTRRGAKVTHRYFVAKTPVSRLIDSPVLSDQEKARLTKRFTELDPVALMIKIENAKDRLARVGNSAPVSKPSKAATRRGRPSGSTNKKTELILPEVNEIMSANPACSSSQLRTELLKRMPDLFEKTNPKTCKGYCQTWRDAHPEFLHLYPKLYSKSAKTRNGGLFKELAVPGNNCPTEGVPPFQLPPALPAVASIAV